MTTPRPSRLFAMWALGWLAQATPAFATMPALNGALPDPVSQAFQAGVFALPSPPTGLQVSAGRTDWYLPIIRVAFPDSSLQFTSQDLQRELFDSTGAVPTGSLYQYYVWVSGHRVRVRGEIVATVMLPHPRNYYANDSYGVNAISTPNNDYGLFRDAVAAADPTVDWNRFDLDGDGFVDMLWIVHAGIGGELSTSRQNLWSITSRSTTGWSNAGPFESNDLIPGTSSQRIRLDRFTILPELSGFHPGAISEIGVFCHEFGHTLGLPDLYDTSSLGGAANVGPGSWSLMSTGAYGGDSRSPESPSHMGAWCSLFLGWIDRYRPTQDTTITLGPISNGRILEFWFEGEPNSEHFLLENRVREQFDKTLPNEGLLISQVDETTMGQRIGSNSVNAGPTPGLRILEGDGDFDLVAGRNRGDASDPLPGARNLQRIDDETTTPSTRTFGNAVTSLALENVQRIGSDVSMHLRVHAPGWETAQSLAPNSDALVTTFGFGHHAVVFPEGNQCVVSSEYDAQGIAQIVLRERGWNGAWGPTTAISGSPAGAIEPTISTLPAHGLAVVWIDSRDGQPQLYYRARIGGAWTAERALTQGTHDLFTPAIAADAKGRVFLTWLEVVNGAGALRFMTFLYSAPYGQATTVTTSDDRPGPPAVAAAGNGHAFLAWPDAGTANGAYTIWCERFHPDSGLSQRFRLIPNSAYSAPSVDLAADTAGTLYSVWQFANGSSAEIHFQRRLKLGTPSPRDTTLDAYGTGLANPRIALDLQGGIHVIEERSSALGTELRYRRWRPGWGWDFRPALVSAPEDVTVTQADVLPISFGNVALVWTSYDGIQQRLRSNRRVLDGGLVAAVDGPGPSPAMASRLAPNPLRAGGALAFASTRPDGALAELLDPEGRRVATARFVSGLARFQPASTGRLAPGIYFARDGGGGPASRLVVIR